MTQLLHQSVFDKYLGYTAPLEGEAVPHMYVDVIGLVTCAYGNLIDPIGAALALPWRNRDGSLAPEEQVRAEWHHLKDNEASLRRRSLGVQATFTTIRLTREACEELVWKKLQENAEFITAHHFPDFASYPADAQLAIMSLAWAAGPGWPGKFPRCKASVLARRWGEAAIEGQLSTTAADGKTPNPGVIPRNKAQRLCFANAYGVEFAGLDPSVLHWPNDAGDGAPLYK